MDWLIEVQPTKKKKHYWSLGNKIYNWYHFSKDDEDDDDDEEEGDDEEEDEEEEEEEEEVENSQSSAPVIATSSYQFPSTVTSGKATAETGAKADTCDCNHCVMQAHLDKVKDDENKKLDFSKSICFQKHLRMSQGWFILKKKKIFWSLESHWLTNCLYAF